MRCGDARDLIYLYRPGELTGNRSQTLKEHLDSCTACRAEWEAALRTEKRVSEVRMIEPVLDDATGLTDAVMRAVAQRDQEPAGAFQTFPEWAFHPVLRIAACIALLALGGTFYFQNSVDAERVAALEGRLRSVNGTARGTGSTGVLNAGSVLPGLGRIETLPVLLGVRLPEIKAWRHAPEVTGETRSLIGKPAGSGTTILDYLAKRHPRLASVQFDDGLDDREREILAAEGEEFLADVESIIRTGDHHHER